MLVKTLDSRPVPMGTAFAARSHHKRQEADRVCIEHPLQGTSRKTTSLHGPANLLAASVGVAPARYYAVDLTSFVQSSEAEGTRSMKERGR